MSTLARLYNGPGQNLGPSLLNEVVNRTVSGVADSPSTLTQAVLKVIMYAGGTETKIVIPHYSHQCL